jgi:hypothetical protein
MLVNESSILHEDAFLVLISRMNGGGSSEKIKNGVYKIGHYGSSAFLEDYEHYPELTVGPYGVCDDLNQLLKACPELEGSDRKFVVTLTSVKKSDQPSEDGWRWHKWGEYIGTKNPQWEYLFNESDEIQEVFVYHIYEKKLNEETVQGK